MADSSTTKTNSAVSEAARKEAEIMDTTPHKHAMLPVWFFIGGILIVYGILICAQGFIEYSDPPIANYHAPIWWGIVLAIVGAIFFQRFYPHKKK
jgi:FtsH-binding integral membrane protein